MFWDGWQWVRGEPIPESPSSGRADGVAGAVAEASLIALLVFGLVAGTAFAGQGGRGDITVPDGVFGGTVTATLNPGGDTWAYAACYQNGTQVYGQYVRANGTDQATFTLGPTPMWTGGDASCTAKELSWQKNGRWRTLASTTFSATDPN